MELKERIRQFITQNFYVADATKLTDESSLLDQGIIDSTGVLELVGFLESEYGIQLADDEIVAENLDSIAAIVGLVGRKRAAS
jgi:acyl carrier protein